MEYVGKELYLFEKAVHWKGYWSSIIAPYMRGDVLEVGAGIGANTALFADAAFEHWTTLEPDASLTSEIQKRIGGDDRYQCVTGTTSDITSKFDVIFYIDVLEHIEDDREEMRRAADLLRPGGTLIMLVPAHQWLFSPLDKAVGHFRRYTKKTLRAAAPPTLYAEKMIYLDSVGLFASLANKVLLKQSMPTEAQIRVWDSLFIPISTVLDRITLHQAGKSVLGIWTKK